MLEELPALQCVTTVQAVETAQEMRENDAALAIDMPTRAVLNALGFAPCSLDDLVERTDLTGAEISAILLMLELDGQVAVLPGQRFQRI